MKRYIPLILLLAAAVGCNKAENPVFPKDSDIELQFNIPGVTRASDDYTVIGTTIPAGRSFGVFAWYGDEASGKPTYMDNQKVSNTGTPETPAFTYFPKRYWPDEGNVTFTAYYPYETGSEGTGIRFADDHSGMSFSVKPDAADQMDFLVADTFTSGKAAGNYSVDIHFRHATAKINVLFKYRPETVRDGERAYPLSIALDNVCMSGNCAPGPIWSNLSDKGTAAFGLTGGDQSACMLIPQDTAPLSFVIDARIEETDGTTVTSYRDKHCVAAVPPIGKDNVTVWSSGTVYTYEILFDGDQVHVELVDITVDNWHKAVDWRNIEYSSWMNDD